jgi:hypothetical protein
VRTMPTFEEGCESGRIGTPGERVWGNSPWVRIPLPPPAAPPPAPWGRDTEPMADMRPDQTRSFLTEGTRVAKLVTVTAD